MHADQGRIVHTHDYKDHRGLEQKNVVVIGVGNSGLDVSCELAKIARQVYLSTRRGFWIGKKSVEKNMPWDVVALRRFNVKLGELLGGCVGWRRRGLQLGKRTHTKIGECTNGST